MRSKPVRGADRIAGRVQLLLHRRIDVSIDLDRRDDRHDKQNHCGDGCEQRSCRQVQPPSTAGGQLFPVVRVACDHHRRGRGDEQGNVAYRLKGQPQAGQSEQELVHSRAPQRETRDDDEDHRLEWAQVDLVEVGREPFDDQLLLRHASLCLERVEVKAEAVGRGEHRHQRSGGDDGQESDVRLVRRVMAIPCPADQLGDQRHPQPGEADHPTSVQVGPDRHHQGKEVEGATAAAEVTLDPVQLEAAQGERDHLGAWSPDRPPGQRTEREA